MRKRKSNKIAIGLIGLGLALGLGAIGLSRHQQRPPAAPAKTARHAAPAPAPSAQKPSTQTVAAYSVPPNLPKFLTIPAIHMDQTRIRQLGVTKDNHIAAPANIYDAGWYNRSAAPGQPGAMFIYGHVSSWQADGAFYNLKKLKPGDPVTVTRGDNTTFTYKVAITKVYPYDHVNMNEVLATYNGAASGLNLMTCTGKVIKGTSEFDQRLVVFATQVKS